jgi:hypothetical protein
MARRFTPAGFALPSGHQVRGNRIGIQDGAGIFVPLGAVVLCLGGYRDSRAFCPQPGVGLIKPAARLGPAPHLTRGASGRSLFRVPRRPIRHLSFKAMQIARRQAPVDYFHRTGGIVPRDRGRILKARKGDRAGTCRDGNPRALSPGETMKSGFGKWVILWTCLRLGKRRPPTDAALLTSPVTTLFAFEGRRPHDVFGGQDKQLLLGCGIAQGRRVSPTLVGLISQIGGALAHAASVARRSKKRCSIPLTQCQYFVATIKRAHYRKTRHLAAAAARRWQKAGQSSGPRRDAPHGRRDDHPLDVGVVGNRRLGFLDLRQPVLPVFGVPRF